MTSSILLGYAAVTGVFWVHALARLAGRERREPLFGLGERLLLGVVALLTSALWAGLLPVYAAGRAQQLYQSSVRGAVRGLRLRPAHRSL